MGPGKHRSQGFTLIASLLILVLLSGVAAGLLFLVTNESKMGGNDLEANLAYYGAEAGMEQITSNLNDLYQQAQAPQETDITPLASFTTLSTVPGITYNNTISFPTAKSSGMPCTLQSSIPGTPPSCSHTMTSGANAGLYAELTPITVNVIATRPSGASVNMTRTVEVVLIPVFQFGVFCAYDCSYHAGENFSFGGRVHANGNLFLTAGTGNSLVFNDKISAYNQVVMDRLPNNYLASGGYQGTVYVPKASSGGCTLTFPPTGANCVALPTSVPGDASWSGGIPSVGGSANANFPSLSSGTLNGYVTNHLTGANKLELPFVKNSCDNPNATPPCTDPISIIRKPQPGESSTSTLGESRLYNRAQIRILLADTQADLHPERGAIADGQDVQFVPGNGILLNANAGAENTSGAAVAGTEDYGIATVGGNVVAPFNYPGWTSYPLLGEVTTPSASMPANGQGAWIRIEYLDNTTGSWVGITTDWLSYGFSRKYGVSPTAPSGSAGADTINPNAIIILQQLNSTIPNTPVGSTGNFYPINFYDAREGQMRDYYAGPAPACSVGGIMNAVELNVGNLALWLAGKAPYAGDVGKKVNVTNENGYVLYFSDHRGMLPDLYPSNGGQTPAGVISGESGLEDVINSSQGLTSSTPDGALEPKTYYSFSPEDVDVNGKLDNWGAANIGYGFGVNTGNLNPYQTTSCNPKGLVNAVTGARHALKLVAGGMNAAGVSYLPIRWDTNSGGFTVASENPVYVQGNYNSGPSDPFWNNNASNKTTHSAAAIIADAVTLLSSNWTDLNSLNNPGTPQGAADAYYRMAIAAGKTVPFPAPGWSGTADFGSDGGLHNYLRLLEDYLSNGKTVYYNGSMASMYFSEYNTGTFKYAVNDVVYGKPIRMFYFDTLFLNPANLPPGTPMFQDIDSLSYYQSFTPGNSIP